MAYRTGSTYPVEVLGITFTVKRAHGPRAAYRKAVWEASAERKEGLRAAGGDDAAGGAINGMFVAALDDARDAAILSVVKDATGIESPNGEPIPWGPDALAEIDDADLDTILRAVMAAPVEGAGDAEGNAPD